MDSYINPQVWDIRISYKVLKDNSSVTALWKQNSNWLTNYSDSDGNTIYRVFHWSRTDAIWQLKWEYVFKLWLFRWLWFILMWFGLAMLFWPISVLLDVLPILWTISKWIISAITFVIAFVLSIITIIISMIFHNIFALIIVIAISWFFGYKFIKKKLDKKAKEKVNIEKSKE